MKKVIFRDKILAMDLAFRWPYRSSKKLAFVILSVIIFGMILPVQDTG